MTVEQVTLRLELIGREAPGGLDPSATIRNKADFTETTTNHDVSRTRRESRELPVISVDLRIRTASSSEVVQRDLEVLGLLGEGGMGRVYLARQHSLDRDVAIKSLHQSGDDWHHRALLEEGAVTGHLEHPAIIPVHALGVDAAGSPVLVMKRVEGVAWLDLLRDPSHPGWRDRGTDQARRLDDHIEILMQVCNAAHYAHSRRIVHRDIKPQNVMIGAFGAVYLVDWGIAFRMDGPAEPDFCGTPSYMAPEMVVGGTIDERTDVYLLGATLHQILTGDVRHPGRVAREVVQSAVRSRPFDYAPSVPPALAAIANRATALDPSKRYQSAAELRLALAAHQRHLSSSALAMSAMDRLHKVRGLLSSDVGRAREDVLREVDLSVAEARFGLTQALEQWSENLTAQKGLRELDALLDSRRARAAKLELLAQDLDPTTASRQRLLIQIAIAVVGGLLSISSLLRGIDYQPSGEVAFRESLVHLILVLSVAVVFRRQLRRTELNRRVIRGFLIIAVLISIERFVGSRTGAPSSSMYACDSLLCAATGMMATAPPLGFLYWICAVMVGSAIQCWCFPTHAALTFALSTALTLLMIVFFSVWMGKKQDAERARNPEST